MATEKRHETLKAGTRPRPIPRGVGLLAVVLACAFGTHVALAVEEEATNVDSAACKAALSTSEAGIQKLERRRDDFASRKKTFIILAGLIGALSSGIAAASPKTRRRLITSLLASLCGALTVASQWYDPSESDKEDLESEKKAAESRRGLLIDGSDTLIDIKGEGDSQVVKCLERRALKQFTRCVSGPETGKDPEPCPKNGEIGAQSSPTVPPSGSASAGVPSSRPTAAGGPRGTGGAGAAPAACPASSRTVLASKTTIIAGKIHDPPHGEITVSVGFGSNGLVDSVKQIGGNGAVLPIVNEVVRQGVKGEPNCEAKLTYQW